MVLLADLIVVLKQPDAEEMMRHCVLHFRCLQYHVDVFVAVVEDFSLGQDSTHHSLGGIMLGSVVRLMLGVFRI